MQSLASFLNESLAQWLTHYNIDLTPHTGGSYFNIHKKQNNECTLMYCWIKIFLSKSTFFCNVYSITLSGCWLCPRSRLLGASVEHGEQDVHPRVHGSQEEVRRVHQRRGVPPHHVLHRQRRSRRPRQSLRMTFDQNGFHKLMCVEAWMIRAGLGARGEVNKHGGTPEEPPNTSGKRPTLL